MRSFDPDDQAIVQPTLNSGGVNVQQKQTTVLRSGWKFWWPASATRKHHQARPRSSENTHAALPDGWQEVIDPSSGDTYYHNKVTDETTWTRPNIPATNTAVASTPWEIGNVTTEWLSKVLSQKVLSFREEKEFTTGLYGTCTIISITYAKGFGMQRPPTLVAKFVKASDAYFKKMAHVYSTELNFYQSMGSIVPCRIPKCFHLDCDPNDASCFVILLEDLSSEFTVLDQAEGISFSDQLEVAKAVGKVHQQFWDHDFSVEAPWMSVPKLPSGLLGHGFTSEKWDNVVAQFRTVEIDAYSYRPEFCKEVMELIKSHSTRLTEIVQERYKTRPKTLCHGDLKADNVFKSKTKGGPQEFAFIDFQFTHMGYPGFSDGIGLFAVNMKQEEDFERIPELIRAYHAAATTTAASDGGSSTDTTALARAWTPADIAEDLVLVCCTGLIMGIGQVNAGALVHGFRAFAETAEGGGDYRRHGMWRQYAYLFRRVFACLHGLDAVSVLRALLLGQEEAGGVGERQRQQAGVEAATAIIAPADAPTVDSAASTSPASSMRGDQGPRPKSLLGEASLIRTMFATP